MIRMHYFIIIFILSQFIVPFTWASSTNYALDFDGSGHVAVPHNSALNLSTFTFEAWIKPQSPLSVYSILSKGEGGSATITSYIFQIQNSKIALFVSETWHFSTTDITPDTWSHIAVSFDDSSDTIQFYLNGEPDGSSTDTDSPYTGDVNVFKIGEQGFSCNCNLFNGQMDEIRVWNTVTNVPIVSKTRQDDQLFFEVSDSNLQNGYYTLGITIDPGPGNALHFDGINDYVELGNADVLKLTNTLSLETWFKPTSSVGNFNTLIGKWYTSGETNV